MIERVGGRLLGDSCPAVVFESPEQSLEAVKAGQVCPGQVVVLRGQGPPGSPGMGMASRLVFALDGAGLTGQVALVRDGDIIRIDVPGRTADLDVSEAEFQARLMGRMMSAETPALAVTSPGGRNPKDWCCWSARR